MKTIAKTAMISSAALIFLGLAGGAGATSYYESYEGNQFIAQNTDDYYFGFDIATLAGEPPPGSDFNDFTNSSLAFTNDASGFDWFNNEQLDFVQIQIDVKNNDPQPEAFNLGVDIFNSKRDFDETVNFNVTQDERWFYYTYDFTRRQINHWERGGWGELTIDAFNIPGKKNFNDFRIRRVAMSAGTNPVPNPVPEPATALLFGAGISGLLGFRRLKTDRRN